MKTIRAAAQGCTYAIALFVLAACSGGNNGTTNTNNGNPSNPPPSTGNGPNPTAQSLPGAFLALTSTGRLVSFNSTTSATNAVTVTGLPANDPVVGTDVRPGGLPAGQLYALTKSGKLYTIDTTTGVATLKSTLTANVTATGTDPFTQLNGMNFDVDFNSVVDRLRVVSDAGENYRINVDTGAVITDGALNTAATARTGITGTAYTNSFAAACRTTLYFIDTANDTLALTTNPNGGVVTDVGSLGVDATAVTGYEIMTGSSGSNSALALLTVSGTPTFYTLNLSTGAATSAGPVLGLNSGETVVSLAAMPPGTAPAQAPGGVLGLTESNTLITFNAAAPQKLCTSSAVMNLQPNEKLLGIDVRPSNGMLYSLGSTGTVYTIDYTTTPGTATANTASTLTAATGDDYAYTGLMGTVFGINFNPVPDRLRVVSDAGQNLRINVDTGATITDTNLNPGMPAAAAASYTNSFVGAGTTTLYVVDSTTDQLYIQGRPSLDPNKGDLQSVGQLGVDISSIAGLEILGLNNTAYAAFNTGGTTSSFYNVNLASGAATLVNPIGGTERVRGLTVAAASIPKATLFGLTFDNQLVSFQVVAPPAAGMDQNITLDTTVAVTGLANGENILGLDFRPANSLLYAVTDQNNIYTLNPTTGAATLVAPLTPNTNDAFMGVMGKGFGVDFNPQADRLRVVSTADQNLRINVDTGATITDTNLLLSVIPASDENVAASAYTQSFAGSLASNFPTKLYGLDVTSASLVLQNPPNAGTLSVVGELGVSFTSFAGFDIAGGDDGLVLAALQPVVATQSQLYRVNLRTGLGTYLGWIGPSGSPLIKAFAIRLQ